ncbi:DUF488 family protein [Candidatus Avelusimicrobium luingense]|uniref:DUF488 domain-containing protein n=1 Tax=Candidatus Avelusimicrobium luingense TaxID=3416211 RepID=UPI003D0F683D
MKRIYTIGYAGFDIDTFLTTLRRYSISVLIDVRSVPKASEYYEAYSKENLRPFLEQNGIIYRNYAHEFGARQNNREYFTNGYLDFKKFTQTETFKSGVEKIEKGLSLNYNFVLMCAEKDPINCHRNIMVAKAMRDMGFEISHILSDGSLQTQEEMDTRLLDLYFKYPSLFDAPMDQKAMLEEAYRRQNEKIGFKEKDIK